MTLIGTCQQGAQRSATAWSPQGLQEFQKEKNGLILGCSSLYTIPTIHAHMTTESIHSKFVSECKTFYKFNRQFQPSQLYTNGPY